eukprot:365951-Chlamydomonas_euryale.AAC.5
MVWRCRGTRVWRRQAGRGRRSASLRRGVHVWRRRDVETCSGVEVRGLEKYKCGERHIYAHVEACRCGGAQAWIRAGVETRPV